MNEIVKQKVCKVSKIVVPVIAVVAIIAAGYFYWQMHLLKQNPQAVAQRETAQVIAKVSKLIVLPFGETPTIAVVADPAALKDQPFFASAKKGDEVLIYAQSKKAILYSVSMNKIIDVAPLNIEAQQPAVQPTTTTTPVPVPVPAPVPVPLLLYIFIYLEIYEIV